MKNSHIVYIVVFILAVVVFGIYSVPRLKEMEAQRTIEQEREDSAAMTRAWEFSDSVKQERLMQDPDYIELLEEIEELKDSISRLNERLY